MVLGCDRSREFPSGRAGEIGPCLQRQDADGNGEFPGNRETSRCDEKLTLPKDSSWDDVWSILCHGLEP